MLYSRTVLLLALCLAASVHAAHYYVAPTGDDANPGSLEKPFATVNDTQKVVKPGDSVFFRGGTYTVKESQIAKLQGIYARVFLLSTSGTAEQPITYAPYENEKPVFDFSNVKPAEKRVHAFSVAGSWIRIKGLDVTGVQVTMKTHTQSICFENEGSNNVFEQLSMHDGQAIGFYSVKGSNNLILNCDAYRNHDFTSEDGKGGNTDGLGYHPQPGCTGNVFRGCRAWFNSDDGYDCINSFEGVTFENCWAFYNGYSPKFEKRADGNGFKGGGYGASPVDRLPKNIPRHTIRFCVAAKNRSSGFYANHHIGGSDWFNNSAYDNSANFNFLCRKDDNKTDVPGYGHKTRNNLSYKSRALVNSLDAAKCDMSHDSFAMELKLADQDFLSLDDKLLLEPRKADGSLPDIQFMHPAPKASFIEKGVDAGFSFTGSAPTLGAFEK